MRKRKITLTVTHRADGRVAKKIAGEYRTWASEDEARQELAAMIRRQSGGAEDPKPAAAPVKDPPLRIIGNLFIADRNARGIKPGTCRDYRIAVVEFASFVGKTRPASDLKPDDFAGIRAKWAASLGPWKLDNRIQSIRTMFNWACDTARMIDRVPWYGDSFRKTTAAEKRKSRRRRVEDHGEKVFSTDELRAIFASADFRGPLKCFILLGLNAGMYASEVSDLRTSDFKTVGRDRIIDTDRGKTGIRRKFILWKETAAAIEDYKKPKRLRNPADRDRIFITAQGNPFVRDRVKHDDDGLVKSALEINSFNMLLGRLLRAARIKREGVGSGAFRATHVSAVGEHPDINAARMVRGHKIEGIEAHYDFPHLSRLRAITDLAYQRLYLPATAGQSRRRGKPPRNAGRRRVAT